MDATGGSGGKITETRQCVARQRLISDSPAVPRFVGLHDGGFSRCAYILFRGRPVHPNSIIVDGLVLFPQMDVWSR
jgi:hypothetical protein